uniref:Uncharacterized protein n=1 Tax=Romanomermis culicivorax TaxID=13658 RepID=A0A915JWM1_ROMCU
MSKFKWLENSVPELLTFCIQGTISIALTDTHGWFGNCGYCGGNVCETNGVMMNSQQPLQHSISLIKPDPGIDLNEQVPTFA